MEKIIKDITDLRNNYVEREGFIFTNLLPPANVYDAIVIYYPSDAECESPIFGRSPKSIKEHIEYINANEIEQAYIIAENIEFLLKCPSLKYLNIIPADTAGNDFDFSPLYKMPEIYALQCDTVYGNKKNNIGYVDYSKIRGLRDLGIHGVKGNINYEKVKTIEDLSVSGITNAKKSVSDFFCSEQLEKLNIIQCSIKTLDGIEKTLKLKSLSMSYMRTLQDISAIKNVKETLTELSLENCPKINDFSVLKELKNLEYLSLMGSNKLMDLSFIDEMKSLKVFIFNMEILDGNLMPCLNIPYVSCCRGYRHYNLKDKDLPKNLLLKS